MARKIRINRWPLVALALLLLGGVIVAGISFAKMIDSSNDNDGSLDVAKWDVSAVGDVENLENDLELIANNGAEFYDFTVTNNSDVATNYSITIANIPTGVSVALDSSDFVDPDDTGKVVFNNISEAIDAGGSKPHTLKVVASLDAAPDTSDITIHIDFAQKEPQ